MNAPEHALDHYHPSQRWLKRTVVCEIVIAILVIQQASLVLFQHDGPNHSVREEESPNAITVLSPDPPNRVANNDNDQQRRVEYHHSNEMTRSSSCREQRGDAGRWVQDWDYANRTHYSLLGSYSNWHLASQRFQPTPAEPFRKATAWRWEDDYCPVQEISRSDFCQVSQKLDISRYLIIGDSMSTEFTLSLLSLIGNKPLAKWRTTHRGINMPFKIHCSSTQLITIQLWKRSPLKDVLYLRDEATGQYPKRVDEHRTFIQENPQKTGILANTGAWIGSLPDYQQALDSLLVWIDSLDSNKIVPILRPTLPGHANCQPNDDDSSTVTTKAEDFDWKRPVQEEPYSSYQEYQRDIQELQASNSTAAYHDHWKMVDEYNSYTLQALQKRPENATKVYWLNIFPSAVLRRDGHVGFGDCLHYYLPGPIDWWVHFWYSMLRDLSSSSPESAAKDTPTTISISSF